MSGNDFTQLPKINEIAYSMVVYFSRTGYTFTIFDSKNNKILTKSTQEIIYTASQEEIVKLISSDHEIQTGCNKTTLVFDTENYTVVPSQLFRPDDAPAYLSFQDVGLKKQTVLYSEITGKDMVMIYSIPSNLYHAVAQLFPAGEFTNKLSYLINNNISINIFDNVYEFVHPKHVDVVVVRNGNIELVNTFAYHTMEDFIYYTLNIYDKLHLDINQFKLSVFTAKNQIGLHKEVKKYIRNTEEFSFTE